MKNSLKTIVATIMSAHWVLSIHTHRTNGLDSACYDPICYWIFVVFFYKWLVGRLPFPFVLINFCTNILLLTFKQKIDTQWDKWQPTKTKRKNHRILICIVPIELLWWFSKASVKTKESFQSRVWSRFFVVIRTFISRMRASVFDVMRFVFDSVIFR